MTRSKKSKEEVPAEPEEWPAERPARIKSDDATFTPAAAAQQVVPAPVVPAAPLTTAKLFTAGMRGDPVAMAFLACEHRENGIRKLSRAEWAKLYDAFRSTERR